MFKKSHQLILRECVKRGYVSLWDWLYAHILCHRITVLHMLFPHYSQLMLQAHTALVPFLSLCGNLSLFFPMYSHLFGSLFLPQSKIIKMKKVIVTLTHNYDFIYHNCNIVSHNCNISQNCHFISQFFFLLYFLFNSFKCICHNCSLYLKITTVTSHNGNN